MFKPAAAFLFFAYGKKFRLFLMTFFGGVFTSGSETAALGHSGEIRYASGDAGKNLYAGTKLRHRGNKALCVRMGRVGKEDLHGSFLDDLSGVHNDDAGTHLSHNAEIVGDEEDAHALVLLDLFHQLQDLGLNGNVQSGGRLVGNQKIPVRSSWPWRS